MRRFFAIVGREWRAYFFSPLGYVIMAGFLLMNGIIFAAIVTYMNQPGVMLGPRTWTSPRGTSLPTAT